MVKNLTSSRDFLPKKLLNFGITAQRISFLKNAVMISKVMLVLAELDIWKQRHRFLSAEIKLNWNE